MAELVYSENGCEIWHGDCLAALRKMGDNTIDSIVTDPPYGLSNHRPEQIAKAVASWVAGEVYVHGGKGFMGKEWDAFVPGPEVWRECLRVLKPGGHIAVFSGSRTVDLMGLAIRLAGFEIRDQLQWIYGSGFPKSLDVSKAIDKAAGAEREVVGVAGRSGKTRNSMAGDFAGEYNATAPATPAAKQWQGWGTALKPAHEPIILARKPLSGTVAENVQERGTGGLNVDGCRVEAPDPDRLQEKFQSTRNAGPRNNSVLGSDTRDRSEGNINASPLGRWPANIILDEQAGALLDAQAGNRPGMSGGGKHKPNAQQGMFGAIDCEHTARGDNGGPSRFFYCPKASRSERELGLTAENMLCSCSIKELEEWVSEDKNQQTEKRAQSQIRDTGEYFGTEDRSWSTDGSGSKRTDDRCPTGLMCTTSTKISSTTGSKISNSSTEQHTSESTLAANSSTEPGGSHAGSAKKESRLSLIIGISAKRGGRCTEDVGRATSRPSSEAKGTAVCARCSKWCSLPSSGAVTGGREEGSAGLGSPRAGAGRASSGRLNIHSTVKPIRLMRWLSRLITPPGGKVLDPFLGSGTTGCAAKLEGFQFVGCELSDEYVRIATARIKHHSKDEDG